MFRSNCYPRARSLGGGRTRSDWLQRVVRGLPSRGMPGVKSRSEGTQRWSSRRSVGSCLNAEALLKRSFLEANIIVRSPLSDGPQSVPCSSLSLGCGSYGSRGGRSTAGNGKTLAMGRGWLLPLVAGHRFSVAVQSSNLWSRSRRPSRPNAVSQSMVERRMQAAKGVRARRRSISIRNCSPCSRRRWSAGALRRKVWITERRRASNASGSVRAKRAHSSKSKAFQGWGDGFP